MKNGLTSEQVLKQREKFGANVMPTKNPVRWQDLLMEKIKDPLIQLLILASVFSIVGAFLTQSSYVDSIGVIVAIVLAVGTGFVNEYSSAKKFEAQNKASNDYDVPVYRDGKLIMVKKSELVVDDVTRLEQGIEVPADCIVIDGTCEIDESAVTGENVPVSKFVESETRDSGHTYANNFLVGSTPVVSGLVIAKVASVGINTEAGKINAVTQGEDEKSPLEENLDKLATLISKLAFAAAGIMYVLLNIKHLGHSATLLQVLFAVSLIVMIYPVIKDTYNENGSSKKDIGIAIVGFLALNAYPFMTTGAAKFVLEIKDVLKVFMEALTLIVVAVPEGLPLAIVLALSNSLKAMLKDNVLIKKLNACETLGAINTICTDKTGTLTQNIMRCEEIFTTNGKGNNKSFLTAFALNSTAQDGIGNPTELGIIEYFGNGEVCAIRERYKDNFVSSVPFNSTIKRSFATYKNVEGNTEFITYVKGAPEIVLDMCDRILSVDSISEDVIDSATKTMYLSTIAKAQVKGMRAIAVGYHESQGQPVNENLHTFETFVFVGYCFIKDPIREDVPAAMEQAKRMGIDVKICTGDNRGTAVGIGTEAKLVTGDFDTYEGSEVHEISDMQINGLKILARSKPMDKHKLVTRLKAFDSNRCIAVTGDGTNDAPAMKVSQCGVSMGNATSIAKQTADVILVDNSFASLIKGIIWGRNIFRNIRKFITFQLTINVSAVVSSIICPLIGLDAPFTIVQMLWINIIMDTLAALAFASNKPTKDLIDKAPRSLKQGVFTKEILQYIFTVGTIQAITVIVASYRHIDTAAVFTGFILAQLFNMINVNHMDTKITSEDPKNYTFISIVFGIMMVQIAAATALHSFFNIEQLNLSLLIEAVCVMLAMVVPSTLFFFINKK